jgi:galactitol-specific phosphotransferase system IIB component
MSEKLKKFCETLNANIYDEQDDYDEYQDTLKQAAELNVECKDLIMFHIERTRDDEKEHKKVLEKIKRMVCPIEPRG